MSQNQDPCAKVKECHDKILEFVALCTSNKKFNFQYIPPTILSEKVKRGSVLPIIVCGRSKSGKSTLVNYLLGSGPNDKEDESKHILPTGKEIRTVAPWIIQDTVNLPSDKISVEHVNDQGKVEGLMTFNTIPELHKHLKKTYAGKPWQLHDHYTQIRLSFGRQNPKLNQRLFSSAVTIIDTQDLYEVGPMIKAMQGPSILVCCFDVSQDLHRSELCTFKNFISSLPNTHVMFVCTHVEAKLCKMQQIRSKTDKPNGSDLNYDALLEVLKKEAVELFTTESFSIPDEMFYFDPTSKSESICSSVYRLQERLVALRKELNIDFYYCQEMKHFLQNQIVAIRDGLSIAGKALLDSAIEKKSQAIAEEFIEAFEAKLNSSLEEEICKLAKKKKSDFMKENPKVGALRLRILNWLLEEGLKTGIALILESMPQKPVEIEGTIINPESKSDLPVELLLKFAEIVGNVLENDIGTLTQKFLEVIKTLTKRGMFKADGLEYLKETIQKIIKEGCLESPLEEIANILASQLCMETKIKLTILPPKILDYVKQNTGIDSEKLEEIQKILDQIN